MKCDLNFDTNTASYMDSGKYTCGIFIDLKKAFDTVNHSILLAKLENYGIRGLINIWFKSYLTDRRQSIEIDNHISKEEKTLCGAPQGSVLGPLLFLLYINDIQKCSSEFTFYLFADDTSIIYAIITCVPLNQQLIQSLPKLVNG